MAIDDAGCARPAFDKIVTLRIPDRRSLVASFPANHLSLAMPRVSSSRNGDGTPPACAPLIRGNLRALERTVQVSLDDVRGNATTRDRAADPGPLAVCHRADRAQEVAEVRPHRPRPRRRMIDDIAILGMIECRERIDVIQREVAMPRMIAIDVAARDIR